MFPPVLAYRNAIGGSQAVVTYGGGTPKVLGDDVLGSVESVTANLGFAGNRVAWFQGTIYVINRNGVYQLDREGTGIGSWNEVQSFTIAVGTQTKVGTLDVWTGPDGSQRLIATIINSSNQIQLHISDDGENWVTRHQVFGASSSYNFWPSGTMYGPYRFFRMNTSNGLYIANMWTGNTADIQENAIGSATDNLTTWNTNAYIGDVISSGGKLYMVIPRRNFTTSRLRLYEYRGGMWTEVLNVDSAIYELGSTAATARNSVCFQDPVTDGIFYCLINGRHSGTTQGTCCIKFDTTGTDITVEDVGDSVFPPALRNDASFGWWNTFVDDITDPMNPVVYFGYVQAADLGQTWSYYSFVDDSSEAILEATIPYGYALPYGNLSDGYRINQLDDNFTSVGSVEFIGDRIIAPDGSLQFSFTVYGGNTGQIGNFYWGERGEKATNVGTLIGTPTGGSIGRSGNNLTNIDGDGVTIYTAFWDFTSDGFQELENVNFKLVVGD